MIITQNEINRTIDATCETLVALEIPVTPVAVYINLKALYDSNQRYAARNSKSDSRLSCVHAAALDELIECNPYIQTLMNFCR